MQGFRGAGASVASYRELRMSGQEGKKNADRSEQRVANFHLV